MSIYRNWKKKDDCKTITEVSLRNFGISDTSVINDWIKKFSDDSYFIYNMDEAVTKTKRLISEGYTFVIFGDYDADGITGTTILARGLIACGVDVKKIQITIPDRKLEGYGAKALHVERIAEKLSYEDKQKVCCLFVDNGIAAKEALESAGDHGFKTIILDHHLAPDDSALKLSDVLVDPEAEAMLYGERKSDFDSYCGAGLAFSFIRKLSGQNVTLMRQVLCFAAIGTVADVMPLREENFCIVKYGLICMANKDVSPAGLYALTVELNLYGAILSAKDIGFSYGPVINAQSRMIGKAGVYDVIRLFMYDGDYSRKLNAADKLIDVNNERKRIQNTGTLIAERMIAEEHLESSHPLVVYIPDINEGIVGVIAGKLSEEYRTPAYVLTDSEEEGILKGSGRSYGNYDMSEALDVIRPVLVSGGGHPGACGLSVKKDDLSEMRKKLSDSFPSDYVFESSDTIEYDLEIKAIDIDRAMPVILKNGPYGEGHKEIIFKVDDFRIFQVPDFVNVLSDGASIRLSGEKAKAFGFKLADQVTADMRKCDIIGVLSEDYFKGRKSIQLEIRDIKDTTNDGGYTETPLAEKLRQMSN